MNYNTLKNDLKKGEIAPVYFFYGEEKYAIDEAISQVIDHTVNPEVRDFNLDVLYGNEIDSHKLLDIATSYPMMADRRTIIIKEIQKTSSNNLTNIAQYTEKPIPTTCMVLIATTGNLKGKTYSQIKKNAISLEFRSLYDNQVAPWIKQYVNERGKEISLQAIQMLQTCVGNSQLNLVNELEKVFLNIQERKEIDIKDVQDVVGFTKEFNIFNLINTIGLKNLRNSLIIVHHLIEQGESATGIIIRLTNYFSTLLKFIEGQKKGLQDRQLAQIAGVHHFFLKDYKTQARNYTSKKIEQIFAFLEEADLNLKTGYQTPKFIIELLVYKIMKL